MRTHGHDIAGAPPAFVFERLLSKYERRFGDAPPVDFGEVDEVTQLMRSALADSKEGDPTHA